MTPIPEDIDPTALALRQLQQLHTSLTSWSWPAVIQCNDCGATWHAALDSGKLSLIETTEGNGSCEAEVLRVISVKGLYAELGRRRNQRRKTVSRAGGRPRKDGSPARSRTASGTVGSLS